MSDQLMLWSEEALARASPSQEIGEVLKTRTDSSCSLMEILSILSARVGSFGKMSTESYPAEKARTLQNSSLCWKGMGMVWRGESLTLDFSECPRNAVESSLSDILETSDVPPQYLLTPKAAAGILRRAERKGGGLPEELVEALRRQSTMSITMIRG